jgi:hypothetical protein
VQTMHVCEKEKMFQLQPTERSQNQALKSSKNSGTVGCCQGAYILHSLSSLHFTHFFFFTSIDQLSPPPGKDTRSKLE